MFILAPTGCLSTEKDSLESIFAAHRAGASGAQINLERTQDGMVVLCSDGYLTGKNGEKISVRENTYVSLKEQFGKVVTVGQAVELAKSYGMLLAARINSPQAATVLKTTLKYADFHENAFVYGLPQDEAIQLAEKHRDLRIMLEVDGVDMGQMGAYIERMRLSGLHGVYLKKELLTKEVSDLAHRANLFVGALQVGDPLVLEQYLSWGVNFIHTGLLEKAAALAPRAESPQQSLFAF